MSTEQNAPESMLDLLRRERVFSVEKMHGGMFQFMGSCDDYFGVDLTREQVLALADELRTLAGPAAVSDHPRYIVESVDSWRVIVREERADGGATHYELPLAWVDGPVVGEPVRGLVFPCNT